MKAKKFITIFLMILAIATTASCSEGNNTDNGESKTKDATAEIKIDVMEDERYLRSAISEFNETHKDVKIVYNTVTPNDEYKNKYITELAAGQGPDIIRIDPTLGLITSVHKTAGSGVFYDINELIN